MTEIDGAQDKLFHEDSAPSLKDHVEVKFVSPDSAKNGDAKINIGDLKTSFAGMGKEELMKFANDPFWVRLRWFLFVLFWVIWCGMLLGAIAIIVYAPKCDANAGEKYSKMPLYEVDVKSFKDGDDKQDGFGDLKGLTSKVDYFKSLGIKQISLASILKSNPEDVKGTEVVNFTEIHPTYGTIDDFKDLVAKLKAADIHLLLSFSPDYSSTKHEFFKKSVQKEEPYTNYYVWAPASGQNVDGTPQPPNNWLSKEGGSAWEWNAQRKEFYLHQFGKNQPDFNFNNPAVVQYFNDVLKFWLEIGVSGFKLENVEYLLEDFDLKNETIANNKPGFTHDQYEFYNHQQTTQARGIGKILDTWGATVHNHTAGVLIVSDSLTENSPAVNLVAHKLEVNSKLTAAQLKDIVDKWNKEKKISWQWSCSDGTLKCIPPSLLDVLNIVSFLLPGTPISRSGEELGLIAPSLMPWNSEAYGGFTAGQTSWASAIPEFNLLNVQAQAKDPLSHYSVYKQLIALRELPAIQSGTLHTAAYNDTVFAFTRVKDDKQGVLVAVNLDPAKQKTVNLSTQFVGIPPHLTVVLASKSTSPALVVNSTISSSLVQLPSYAGAVFTFTPHSAA